MLFVSCVFLAGCVAPVRVPVISMEDVEKGKTIGLVINDQGADVLKAVKTGIFSSYNHQVDLEQYKLHEYYKEEIKTKLSQYVTVKTIDYKSDKINFYDNYYDSYKCRANSITRFALELKRSEIASEPLFSVAVANYRNLERMFKENDIDILVILGGGTCIAGGHSATASLRRAEIGTVLAAGFDISIYTMEDGELKHQYNELPVIRKNVSSNIMWKEASLPPTEKELRVLVPMVKNMLAESSEEVLVKLIDLKGILK